jgi:MFS family permease
MVPYPRDRNIPLLALCYALGFAGAPLVVLVGGIAGAELAPRASLSTAPIAAMVVGTALATVPAAVLMKRLGRRIGFVIGALVAGASAVLCAWSLETSSFGLLCLGAAGIGLNGAFIQQYRFAAAESVGPSRVTRAVSTVLAGGIVAALLGPEIARRTQHWSGHADYALSFVVLAVVYAVAALVLGLIRDAERVEQAEIPPSRPVSALVSQPRFLLAVLAATVAYGGMSFVMTATPVSMHHMDGHSLSATAIVIQSHLLAMYIPTLAAGPLVRTMGLAGVLVLGVAAMACGALTALAGHAVAAYWVALVLVGIGWSLLFVGATVLLTQTYEAAERYRAQGINDFTVFGVQAVGSLGAGAVLVGAGWGTVNLIALAPLAVLGVLLFVWRRHVGAVA